MKWLKEVSCQVKTSKGWAAAYMQKRAAIADSSAFLDMIGWVWPSKCTNFIVFLH